MRKRLEYIVSKKETVTMSPPLPAMLVFEWELCLESDGTRVNGIQWSLFNKATLREWTILPFHRGDLLLGGGKLDTIVQGLLTVVFMGSIYAVA